MTDFKALADRASTLHGRSLACWRQCADVLKEAKAAAKHGQWRAFLKEAGIPETTARRMLRVAVAGVSLDLLSSLGIHHTLLYLDAGEEALWFYGICMEQMAPKMGADERDAMRDAYPDNPYRIYPWCDFARAVCDDGMDAAWPKRPWRRNVRRTVRPADEGRQ